MLMNLEIALSITERLIGIWATISSAEWLVGARLFADDGILSWRVLGLRRGAVRTRPISQLVASIEGTRVVLVLRLLAGVAMLFAPQPLIALPVLVLLLGTHLWMSYRSVFGGDGSDQMGLVLMIGSIITVAGLCFRSPDVAMWGMVAIAGQATLSYFFAGAAKFVSPIWRGGDALMGVMKTQTYGHVQAERLGGSHPSLAKVICWVVIVTEMLFPLVLFAPTPILIAALCGFAFFHVSNAYFMGLNTFVWTFVGTYPAVILINGVIRSFLGWT